MITSYQKGQHMIRLNRGFTLIELLIVVAIIAILAAIAVPNFLEAQTRAKVARAKSDLRTLAVGLEAYHVDNNSYPYLLDLDVGEYIMPAGLPPGREGPGGLTTPVAYLTTELYDPFVGDSRDNPSTPFMPRGKQLLHYERLGFGYGAGGVPFNDNGTGKRAIRVPVDANGGLLGTGPDPNVTDERLVPARYILWSIGPDRTHRVYAPDGSIVVRSRFSIWNRYDPTNGTVSVGNIIRLPGGESYP